MPAILKGYIDRIFSNGFAYTMQDYRPVGLLKDKKAILINSMGMSYEEYKEKGMFEAMRLTIDEGIFGFTGMEVILHKYYTSIMSADDSVKAVYLDELSILAQSFVENEADCTGDKKDRKVA